MKGRLPAIIAALVIILVVGVGGAIGAFKLLGKANAKNAHGKKPGHGESKQAASTGHAAGSPAARGDGEEAEPTPVSEEAEDAWGELMEGNARFVDGDRASHDLVQEREKLAEGQHPTVIVLTCSDSRVSPELLFDQGLGELFVIRVAGNIADKVGLGSIEYAVEHLHAHVVVVLGHEKCGAVAAAAGGKAMPTPNLTSIVKQISPALSHVRRDLSADETAREQVIANVRRSAADLLRNSPILGKEEKEQKLAVIKAIYSLETGEVERL